MDDAFALRINDLTVLAIVAVALYFDLKYRRVPNCLVLFGLVGGVLISALLHGVNGPIAGLLGLLTAALIFTPPYLLGALGAGDVKLVCMIGVFMGPTETLFVLFYASLAGGFLVIALYLTQRLFIVFRGLTTEYSPKIDNFPYVSAIFSGMLITLIQKYWGVIQ